MPDHLKHIAYVCDFCKQNGALSNALSREAHFGGDASLDSLPHRPGGAPSPEIGNRAGPQNTLSKIGSLTPRLAARTTRWPSSPPRLQSVIADAGNALDCRGAGTAPALSVTPQR